MQIRKHLKIRATTALLSAQFICVVVASDAYAQENTLEDVATEDVSSEDEMVVGPALIDSPLSPYPPQALEVGLEATVVLLVELDKAGAITSVQVVEPVGNGFDEAAIEAVQAMTFSPAETTSGPIPIAFEMAYDFRIPPPPEPEPVATPAPENLTGILIEKGTRKPISGASISVVGTKLVAITDELGAFAIRGVPDGVVEIRAVHVGHNTVTQKLEIKEGAVATVKLWSRADSYRENEALALYEGDQTEVTHHTLTIKEVRRIPGTFGDPVRIIQTLPGVAKAPFGSGLLIIRGSNPEDSGVYVDGVRIPLIYHLTGTSSVLAPNIMENVDYLPGGYGVQYGRTMGGAVDIKTRDDFEDSLLTWGTDILDSQIFYEGRVGKEDQGAIAVGARRSYIDKLLPFFLPGDLQISPRYWDYQLKYIPRAGEDFSIFLHGFNDLLTIATPADSAQGSDQDFQGDIRTEYGTHRVIVNYETNFSDRVDFMLKPSFGYDTAGFGLGDELTISQRTWLMELRSELRFKTSQKLTLVAGLDAMGGPWDFIVTLPFSYADMSDPLAEREPISTDGNGWGWSPDSYIKAEWRPLQDPQAMLIVPGLRFNNVGIRYSGTVTGNDEMVTWSQSSVDPRLAIRSGITEKTAIKAATGIYHQPPQPFEMVGFGVVPELMFEKSWSSSIGFEQKLGVAVSIDFEIYHKEMSDLIAPVDDWQGTGNVLYENPGLGQANGLEVIARHNPVGNFFGWVSYTLSKSERQDGVDLEPYLFDFDQTHIFSAQGGYDLPHDFGVSLQVQYVTGKPATLYNAAAVDLDSDSFMPMQTGEYNGQRMPDFFQTSLRFDKLFSFKRWQLETYVDLMNIVRGTNPEFLVYNYDYTESAYVSGLPFIPNIGLEAKFWP